MSLPEKAGRVLVVAYTCAPATAPPRKPARKRWKRKHKRDHSEEQGCVTTATISECEQLFMLYFRLRELRLRRRLEMLPSLKRPAARFRSLRAIRPPSASSG